VELRVCQEGEEVFAVIDLDENPRLFVQELIHCWNVDLTEQTYVVVAHVHYRVRQRDGGEVVEKCFVQVALDRRKKPLAETSVSLAEEPEVEERVVLMGFRVCSS
jgi:hypothetical protein